MTALTPKQITLVPGGSSVALVLTGNNMSSSDTLDYGDDGITDNTSPVVATTSITLDLVADVSVSSGLYDLTFNNHFFRNVVKVQ